MSFLFVGLSEEERGGAMEELELFNEQMQETEKQVQQAETIKWPAETEGEPQ